jgi:hypothetical protein
MLGRRLRVPQALVTKVVDVLDEDLDFLAGVGLARARSRARVALDLITGQGLAQHGHQRAVAGEVDAVGCAGGVEVPVGNVEPDQRLAGSRDAGDEADRLALSSA